MLIIKYIIYFITMLIIGGALFVFHVQSLSGSIDNISKHDAIIVLTGGEKRIDFGIDLLKNDIGQKLLISGVHPDTHQGNFTSQNELHSRIELDKAALDTYGNALAAKQWLRYNQFQSTVVVTANYNMPRAMIHFHRLLPDIIVTPFTVIPTSLSDDQWWKVKQNWHTLAKAYAKFLLTLPLAILPTFEQNIGDEPIKPLKQQLKEIL